MTIQEFKEFWLEVKELWIQEVWNNKFYRFWFKMYVVCLTAILLLMTVSILFVMIRSLSI